MYIYTCTGLSLKVCDQQFKFFNCDLISLSLSLSLSLSHRPSPSPSM